MFEKIRKLILVSALIGAITILTACSKNLDTDAGKNEEEPSAMSIAKQIATPFIMKAADGYVNKDNYITPHTFVVDTYQNEVYADVYEEPSGLTPEEIIENAKNTDEVEESIYPIFEVESLNVSENSFTLQYDAKTVEFTALSESYYEDQKGVRYTIEPHSGIEEYIESFYD